MAKIYNWRADLNFQSGDPGSLSHGVTPSAQENWQTAEAGGSMSPGQYTYWYRDSNTAWQGEFQDILSSRVALAVTQTWTTSIDSRNNLTVTINTTVNSIDRDDVRHPSGYYDSNTPGRDIKLYDGNGTQIWSTIDNQVATAHNLSGQISVGTETFTLAPGNITVVKPSLYLHNQTVGGSSYDDIWLGIQFRNPLPAETIPHAVLGPNGEWLSHNRAGGDLRLYNGSRWTDNLANTDGGEGYGDPPSIYKDNKWLNARLIGKE